MVIASLAAMHAAGYRGCLRLADARLSYIIGPGKLYDWTRSTLGQKTNTILIKHEVQLGCSRAYVSASPVP